MLCEPAVGEVPGDLEYGEAYRCDEAATAAAAVEKGVAALLVGGLIAGPSWDCVFALPALVVMVRGLDMTVVVVVETWAFAARLPGNMTEFEVLDFAWKVGFVRARNAEKKLAKKGLCVGAMLYKSCGYHSERFRGARPGAGCSLLC
jgi:hypothetical protein